MGPRARPLILIVALILVFIAVPTIVNAAGGTFVDDDASVFEADIEWLAGAGVTLGCNPPVNDRFCPEDNVSRGQMAAFMRRFAEFLGAEDGVVSAADLASNATNAASSAYAADSDLLDGHDSSYFTGNDGYSVWHDAEIAIPTDTTSLLELPNLPSGSYMFIAKTWLYNGGPGEQFAECWLGAGADNVYLRVTLADTNFGVPVTWTVVHTFTDPANEVELRCGDYGFDVSLNNTKITGIRLDSLRNQPG